MKKPEYHIGIIGCGKMGKEIFNFLTQFRYGITLVCNSEEQAKKLDANWKKKLRRSKKFNLIDEKSILFMKQHIAVTSRLEMIKDVSLVIESVSEDLAKKKALYTQLERIVTADCILTTNTSSFDPDVLFSGTKNIERCLGMHFFSPVSIKEFVEVNAGSSTSRKTKEAIFRFAERINKKPLLLQGKNLFLINRIFLEMQAKCCEIHFDYNISEKVLDDLIKTKLFPVGIFETFEKIGYQVLLQSVINYLTFEPDHDNYQPLIDYLSFSLKKVKADQAKKEPDQVLNQELTDQLLRQITISYLNGVFKTHAIKAISKSELVQIVREYLMTDQSPFDLADQVGFTYK